MNKLFSKIAALSVGLAMAVGVGVAVGQESVKEVRADTTVSFTPGTDTGATTVTKDNVTVTLTTMNNANYYQIYANQTGTISCSGGNITGISFTCTASGTAKYGPGNASTDVGTYTYSGKNGSWTGSAATVVISTTAQIRMSSLSVTYLTKEGATVAIDNAPSSLDVGDTGKLTATTSGATSPVIEWSSSDPTVVSIDKDTGDYEALKCGAVTFTASMTCTEGSDSATTTKIPVNGVDVMSVSDAVAIAESFDDSVDTVTEYTVLVKGYIVSFDESIKDSKPRAIKISDSKKDSVSDTDSILAYGIYSDNPLRSYAILNGELTVRAKIENYKGTNELSSLTIEDYTDEAIAYAKTAYESLNEACATGPAAVTDEQWEGLASDFGALDEYAKEKLAAAGSDYQYSEDIANWIGRYGRIVAAGRTNFMENNNVSSQYFSNFESSNNSYIIIIVIASVSVLSFGLALALRKKRTK